MVGLAKDRFRDETRPSKRVARSGAWGVFGKVRNGSQRSGESAGDQPGSWAGESLGDAVPQVRAAEADITSGSTSTAGSQRSFTKVPATDNNKPMDMMWPRFMDWCDAINCGGRKREPFHTPDVGRTVHRSTPFQKTGAKNEQQTATCVESFRAGMATLNWYGSLGKTVGDRGRARGGISLHGVGRVER